MGTVGELGVGVDRGWDVRSRLQCVALQPGTRRRVAVPCSAATEKANFNTSGRSRIRGKFRRLPAQLPPAQRSRSQKTRMIVPEVAQQPRKPKVSTRSHLPNSQDELAPKSLV